MKTQVSVRSYFDSSFSVWKSESNSNGNLNSLPAPNLQLRPMSARKDWVPARYKNSGLPSSLEAWLASKTTVIIG
jgi:hypothetical protein